MFINSYYFVIIFIMFYYLLYNSSFIKTEKIKEKIISTIIYASFIYLIIHAVISFSFNRNDILKYFWVILIIDLFTLIFKNDVNLLKYFSNENDDDKIDFINKNVNDIRDLKKDKPNKKLKKRSFKKKNISFDKEEILEFNKKDPVNKLKINTIDEDELNAKLENINLTLDNLEKLNENNKIDIPEFKNNNLGSSNINDLKKDDELSDTTSVIDLTSFEESLLNQ